MSTTFINVGSCAVSNLSYFAFVSTVSSIHLFIPFFSSSYISFNLALTYFLSN